MCEINIVDCSNGVFDKASPRPKSLCATSEEKDKEQIGIGIPRSQSKMYPVARLFDPIG